MSQARNRTETDQAHDAEVTHFVKVRDLSDCRKKPSGLGVTCHDENHHEKKDAQ
jgi:hypothetical protein